MRIELALLVLPLACRAEGPDALRIFTAASMQEPVEALADGAEISAAASSVLARQIASGAEADLFISADLEWADYLATHIPVQAQKIIASNRLVLIAPNDERRSADALLSGRLALGDPSHVPAGKYAQAALQKLGRYREGSVAAAADVRAALALVERGEVDAGIVYRTDALLSTKVRIVAELETPTPIHYAAVLLDPRAKALFDRLTAPDGQRVLGRFGFLPP